MIKCFARFSVLLALMVTIFISCSKEDDSPSSSGSFTIDNKSYQALYGYFEYDSEYWIITFSNANNLNSGGDYKYLATFQFEKNTDTIPCTTINFTPIGFDSYFELSGGDVRYSDPVSGNITISKTADRYAITYSITTSYIDSIDTHKSLNKTITGKFEGSLTNVSDINNPDNNPDTPINGKTTAVFNSDVTYGTMSDQEGNSYKTVVIGTQTWMAENLRTTKYRNGDPISNVKEDAIWSALTTGAYCNYQNTTNETTIATYGRFYNGYTVVDNRNIAPSGWHIATKEDWETLITYLGGVDNTGKKIKESGSTHWGGGREGFIPGTNESGFTALPGGNRSDDGRMSDYMGRLANFYSSSAVNGTELKVYGVRYEYDKIIVGSSSQKFGYSIRCVKD